MAALAIYATDAVLRNRLESLLRQEAAIVTVGVSGDVSDLARVIEKNQADIVLAEFPSIDQLAEWRGRYPATAFIIMISNPNVDGLDALCSGADAILPLSADDSDIATVVQAVRSGLVVMPRHILDTLLRTGSADGSAPLPHDGGAHAPLTRRELEVLVSMADGASNKTIARRLGISFHTVKFHVAAILVKLDADSRTEAVTKAAQLGLVML
jgi:two-component system, NarL family, response regulator YdfI